jgi:hypothetical protein
MLVTNIILPEHEELVAEENEARNVLFDRIEAIENGKARIIDFTVEEFDEYSEKLLARTT